LLETAIEQRRPARAQASRPSAPAPLDVRRFVAETAPWRPAHFLHGIGIGLGVAALGAGGGPSYAPAARLSWGAASGFGLRLSVVGLGSEVTFESRDAGALLGRASVHRELALLDGFFVLNRGGVLQPFTTVGGGVSRVRAEGQGATPLFPDQSGARLGGLASAGAGVAVRLGARAALAVEAELLLLLPRTRVIIADQTAATVGGPSALLSAGLTTSF
jgi:hypothetical protein